MVTATTLFIVSTAFTVTAFIFTALRCYSRFVILRSFGMDDILAVVAFITSAIFTVFIFAGRKDGLGQDISTLVPPDLSEYRKYFWIAVVVYCVSLTTIKVSALLQCLRFILLGKMRIFCWCSIASITIIGLLSLFINVLACTPVQAFWDSSIPNAKCVNLAPYWYFASGAFTITDILVVVIPVLTVKDMKLPRRQKAALIVVFVLGGFACIASVIRVYALTILDKSTNPTRDNADAIMWSSLELNVGIIGVSIPPLKPVMLAIAPRLIGSQRQSEDHVGSAFSGETLAVHQFHQIGAKDTDIELGNINSTSPPPPPLPKS